MRLIDLTEKSYSSAGLTVAEGEEWMGMMNPVLEKIGFPAMEWCDVASVHLHFSVNGEQLEIMTNPTKWLPLISMNLIREHAIRREFAEMQIKYNEMERRLNILLREREINWKIGSY